MLAGIAIHSVAQTILMFLKLAADPEKQLASIEYWIMGSLNGISRDSLAIPFFTTLAGFIVIAFVIPTGSHSFYKRGRSRITRCKCDKSAFLLY